MSGNTTGTPVSDGLASVFEGDSQSPFLQSGSSKVEKTPSPVLLSSERNENPRLDITRRIKDGDRIPNFTWSDIIVNVPLGSLIDRTYRVFAPVGVVNLFPSVFTEEYESFESFARNLRSAVNFDDAALALSSQHVNAPLHIPPSEGSVAFQRRLPTPSTPYIGERDMSISRPSLLLIGDSWLAHSTAARPGFGTSLKAQGRGWTEVGFDVFKYPQISAPDFDLYQFGIAGLATSVGPNVWAPEVILSRFRESLNLPKDWKPEIIAVQLGLNDFAHCCQGRGSFCDEQELFDAVVGFVKCLIRTSGAAYGVFLGSGCWHEPVLRNKRIEFSPGLRADITHLITRSHRYYQSLAGEVGIHKTFKFCISLPMPLPAGAFNKRDENKGDYIPSPTSWGYGEHLLDVLNATYLGLARAGREEKIPLYRCIGSPPVFLHPSGDVSSGIGPGQNHAHIPRMVGMERLACNLRFKFPPPTNYVVALSGAKVLTSEIVGQRVVCMNMKFSFQLLLFHRKRKEYSCLILAENNESISWFSVWMLNHPILF